MPPTKAQGKQSILVGPDNQPMRPSLTSTLAIRAALAEQTYNPRIGFSLVHDVARNPNTPYIILTTGLEPKNCCRLGTQGSATGCWSRCSAKTGRSCAAGSASSTAA